MRTARLVLAVAVTGTVVATGVGAAVEAAPNRPCGAVVRDVGNGWQGITPGFTVGGTKIQQLVQTPYVPDRMWVTNGRQLLLTDDAGCHWKTVATPAGGRLGLLPEPLDGMLTLPSTAQIVAIAAPSSATSNDRFYFAYNDTSVLGAAEPHIESYGNGRWVEAGGLPRFGKVAMSDLAASPTVPTTAFAVIDPVLGGDGGVYSTSDGGQNWTQRNATQRSSTLQDLRVDPVVDHRLYGRNSSGLVASGNGGASFSPLHPAGDMGDFDVAPAQNSSVLVAGHEQRKTFDLGALGGTAWLPCQAPVRAVDVAVQPITPRVVVADGSHVWLQPRCLQNGRKNITPGLGAPTHLQLTAPLSLGYAIVGFRGSEVFRTVKNLNDDTVVGVGKPVVLLPHRLDQFPSTLTPDRTKVSLPPGGHRDVIYKLLLPRTPAPVDIMFLVDTTASTDKTIAGLKQDLAGIVNDLASAGLDAQFGVADFKDYSPTPGNIGDGEPGDYPYRLDRTIGPVNDSLRQALDRLRARGGGDPAESQLTALYQSTTGSGQTYGKHVIVPSGEDAGYRSQAMHLAVLATDERFHHEAEYLTPSWQRTIATLRAHRVHPIGLAVQSVDDQGNKHGFHSLAREQQLARETGSLAPAGGVDCNGDLVPDLAAGDPLVCKVPVNVTKAIKLPGGRTLRKSQVLPVKLGPAITRAAETLPDMRTVRLDFAGAHGVAEVVKPNPLPRVNIKNDNALTFTVRYTCPKLHKPHLYRFDVSADTGAGIVASSNAQVACGAVPPPHHHGPAGPPPIAAAAPVAAAAAPPQPGQPIPNTNPNPNPALNANVGFASQEEEQRQLAFAGADTLVEEDPTVEMSMSRLGSGRSGGSAGDEPWIVGGAAVLLTGAAGYAARTRFSVAWQR